MSQKILLIDDEPDFIEMITMRLDAAGYTVHSAMDGKAGLASARDVKPDFVLLDVNMPGMDGGEVAQRLQETPELSHIPFAFLTALVGEREAAASKANGAKEIFLSKTGGSDKILSHIESVLGRSAARQ